MLKGVKRSDIQRGQANYESDSPVICQSCTWCAARFSVLRAQLKRTRLSCLFSAAMGTLMPDITWHLSCQVLQV